MRDFPHRAVVGGVEFFESKMHKIWRKHSVLFWRIEIATVLAYCSNFIAPALHFSQSYF